MKSGAQWARSLEVMGGVAFVVGSIDPMEGSVLILAGSAAIAGAMWLDERPRDIQKFWAATSAMIAFGVMWLWILTWMGGVGGHSKLSIWWGLLVLPYLVGWLTGIIGIIRLLRHWREKRAQESALKA